MEFDHIGIFVESLVVGREHLGSIFGIKKWEKPVVDSIQGVKVQFGYDSKGICYEIVAPNAKVNPVDNVLKQAKNILNHVAYKVDDIYLEIKRLQESDSILISGPVESAAFNNKKISFLYTPLKFVIELIEK